jgi:cell division protein FtsI/penicillin-binding protein 2
LARSRARAAAPARTTIDTRIQAAAVTALAGRLGGIAALDPQNGEVRALAGIAFSAPQPPGSTFKIVTTSAGLEQHKVKLSDKFPVESHAVLDGVNLDNANRELCGGTFAESFAHSCNSVFGPLGAKIGADGLIEYAKRFGWNSKPTIPGEAASTFPPADKLQNPLEAGSAAIGQSEVLATPLLMASVAQTIANRGLRFPPTLVPSAPQKPIRVITGKTAKAIEGLMAGVVVFGTGTAAQIPGVKVAGKTGTAELEDTKDEEGNPTGGGPENTDAWFASYAPIGKPTIAVAVLLVRNGAGGDTAAPAAQTVMVTALQK